MTLEFEVYHDAHLNHLALVERMRHAVEQALLVNEAPEAQLYGSSADYEVLR